MVFKLRKRGYLYNWLFLCVDMKYSQRNGFWGLALRLACDVTVIVKVEETRGCRAVMSNIS